MSEQETNNQENTPEATSQALNLGAELQGFSDVVLNCRALLGKVRMPSVAFLKLTRGSIVELEKKKTDLLDITVNGLKVAEGEIVLQNDSIAVEVISSFKKPKFMNISRIGS